MRRSWKALALHYRKQWLDELDENTGQRKPRMGQTDPLAEEEPYTTIVTEDGYTLKVSNSRWKPNLHFVAGEPVRFVPIDPRYSPTKNDS